MTTTPEAEEVASAEIANPKGVGFESKAREAVKDPSKVYVGRANLPEAACLISEKTRGDGPCKFGDKGCSSRP